MTPTELLHFMRGHSLAVQASVSPEQAPQAAVVGFAVTDRFELFFDTIDTSRKAHNLRQNPHVAFVIGGLTPGDERTVQYEGVVDEPKAAELSRLKEVYFGVFPDGVEHQQWPGIMYVRVRPTWIRFSDFNRVPAEIAEFGPSELEGSGPVRVV